jgi:diguanylate cyclase (GGDEF)-like protein/hemerythrin-like metal-binding protein
MHNLKWKPELSVGIENIDKDHKRLIELTNTLINAINNEIPPEELLKIFNELEAYTHYHFEREEAFMNEHCTSADIHSMIQKHKEQHRYFIGELSKLKETLKRATSKSVAYEIVEFLLHWLLDHIINEDLKLTQCLKKSTAHTPSFIQRITHTLRKKTTLYQRFWIIIALPLVFFILQTLFISYNAYSKYKNLREVEHITQAAVNINNIITQLQKERGLSSAYISSDHTHFAKALKIQRYKTDKVIQESLYAKTFLDPYIDTTQYIVALKKLKKIRQAIDHREIDQQKSVAYYTDFIRSLIDVIKHISYLPFNSVDKNTYSPILLLLNLNEIQGLMRNEGLVCLENPKASCITFRHLLQKKESYLSVFNLLAPTHLKEAVSHIEQTPHAKQLKQIQIQIPERILSNSNTAQEWFMQTTLHIDKYKHIIETVLKQIEYDAYMQKKHFLSLILAVWAIFSLILLFIGVSIYLFKESILHPLNVLTDALHKLSSGNKSIYFSTVSKKDAIGRMEHAYNHLRRSLIKADYANILMELQELKTQKYEKLSEEDPLTGIYNRRAFMQILEYEVEQAYRQHRPLSLLLLDLDHFKQVNDTYGHETGDKLLQHFVTQTKELIRSSDIFARIGGEEFVLLLPDTSLKGAYTLAEKIVSKIATLKLDTLAPNLHITVSIGITVLEKEMTASQLLKQADIYLYRAKDNGRNQVCCI